MTTLNDICGDIKVRDGKSIIESCEKINGYPSFIMFSHDTGVRYAYIGVPSKEALYNYNKVESRIMEKEASCPWLVSIGRERLYTEVCNRMLDANDKDLHWIAFDCGHVGETFDEQAIRAYYPEDADKIIDVNSWRNGEHCTVRSLDYCKSFVKLIADTFKEYENSKSHISLKEIN